MASDPKHTKAIEPSAEEIRVTSLGPLTIDTITLPNRPTVAGVLGGSGVYFTAGVRLLRMNGQPPVHILLVANYGKGFTVDMKKELEGWGIWLKLIEHPQHNTLERRLEYDPATIASGVAKHSQTSGDLYNSVKSIKDTPAIRSEIFHLVGGPSKIRNDVEQILNYRLHGGCTKAPSTIWELELDDQNPDEDLRTEVRSATELVRIFSPTHIALAKLLGSDISESFNRTSIEAMLDQFVGSGPENSPAEITGERERLFKSQLVQQLETSGPHEQLQGLVDSYIELCQGAKQAIIVRSGSLGYCVRTEENGTAFCEWLDPWHEGGKSYGEDPTGAGSAFLGGLARGLLLISNNDDVLNAAHKGLCAAKFATEQIGLPKTDGVRWNGRSMEKDFVGYVAWRMKKGMEAWGWD